MIGMSPWGLTQALSMSLSGWAVTQASLGVVVGNVADAQTPGYVAQSVSQQATLLGDAGVLAVNLLQAVELAKAGIR